MTNPSTGQPISRPTLAAVILIVAAVLIWTVPDFLTWWDIWGPAAPLSSSVLFLVGTLRLIGFGMLIIGMVILIKLRTSNPPL